MGAGEGAEAGGCGGAGGESEEAGRSSLRMEEMLQELGEE